MICAKMRRDDVKCEPDKTSASSMSHTIQGQLEQTLKKRVGMCESMMGNVYVWVM